MENRLDSLLGDLNTEIKEEESKGATSGFVSQEELSAILKKDENFQDLDEKDLEFIFKRFDVNKDGFIDITELDGLKPQLGQKISEIERNRVREEMERQELEQKLQNKEKGDGKED